MSIFRAVVWIAISCFCLKGQQRHGNQCTEGYTTLYCFFKMRIYVMLRVDTKLCVGIEPVLPRKKKHTIELSDGLASPQSGLQHCIDKYWLSSLLELCKLCFCLIYFISAYFCTFSKKSIFKVNIKNWWYKTVYVEYSGYSNMKVQWKPSSRHWYSVKPI